MSTVHQNVTESIKEYEKENLLLKLFLSAHNSY